MRTREDHIEAIAQYCLDSKEEQDYLEQCDENYTDPYDLADANHVYAHACIVLGIQPEFSERWYVVTVTGEPTDYDDIEDNPTGEYRYLAANRYDALTKFHNDIPIACLDDFKIEAEPVN